MATEGLGKVGFVGVGGMGRGIASNIYSKYAKERNEHLYVWNRTRDSTYMKELESEVQLSGGKGKTNH